MSDATDQIAVRLVQMAPRLGDVSANVAFHQQAIAQARADGIDLLVFPELSLTGYYLRDLVSDVAITADGDLMRQLAAEAGHIHVVLGFVEVDRGGALYCAAACLHDGRVTHVHRKVYLPTYGMFDEGRYLSAGDRLRAFDLAGARAGLTVCEDMWHLSVPLLLSRQGVDITITLSASPVRGIAASTMATRQAWEDLLATYARLLQQFVVFCNRVGYEDGVAFWGGSGVWAPGGHQLARCPILEEGSVDAILDLRDIRSARAAVPLVADERDELTLREMERILRERARGKL